MLQATTFLGAQLSCGLAVLTQLNYNRYIESIILVSLYIYMENNAVLSWAWHHCLWWWPTHSLNGLQTGLKSFLALLSIGAHYLVGLHYWEKITWPSLYRYILAVSVGHYFMIRFTPIRYYDQPVFLFSSHFSVLGQRG